MGKRCSFGVGTSSRICTSCGETKPISKFRKDLRKDGGYYIHPMCAMCSYERRKARARKRNSETEPNLVCLVCYNLPHRIEGVCTGCGAKYAPEAKPDVPGLSSALGICGEIESVYEY